MHKRPTVSPHIERRVHVIDGNSMPRRIKSPIVVDFHLVGGNGITFDHHNAQDRGKTATSIALEAVRRGIHEKTKPIVTNHLDTDSVLSMYTVLRPNKALEFKDVLEKAAQLGDYQKKPSGKDSELASKIHYAIEGMIDEHAEGLNNSREGLNAREKTRIMHKILSDMDLLLADSRPFKHYVDRSKERIESDKKRTRRVDKNHPTVAIVVSDGPYLHPVSRHSLSRKPFVLMQYDGEGRTHYVFSANPEKDHIMNPTALKELSALEYKRRGGQKSGIVAASVKWGGRDRAGGSHRKKGSILKPEEVRRILAKHIERPNHNKG
jgi:hypothetical protein